MSAAILHFTERKTQVRGHLRTIRRPKVFIDTTRALVGFADAKHIAACMEELGDAFEHAIVTDELRCLMGLGAGETS